MATIATVCVMCLLVIGGEIAFRAYHAIAHMKSRTTPAKKRPNALSFNDELGWVPTGNYKLIKTKTDASGHRYAVNFQTNEDGFRIFGNPEEEHKKKVWFLGDSFTYAKVVSNNKTYYGRLKDTLPIEVFAFGCSGYGTLQEYMILDKYLDDIRPDIIIVQFCSNDFINNSYELELRSNRNNNGMRRPYFINNEIIYRLPKHFPRMRGLVNTYSQFLYFILHRIDRLHARSPRSVEDLIAANASYPFFRESVEITDHIVKKMMLRIHPTTLVYAFSVDDSAPYYDEFKNISARNGIYFIDDIPQAIYDAERQGITTRAADKAHWNEAGHQIAATALQSYLEAPR